MRFSLVAFAVLFSQCLPSLHAACADKLFKSADCAKQGYASSAASSADACCAVCASEEKCKQWTYHSISRQCDRTSVDESKMTGMSTVFSTCGIRAPMPPPPPSPPAPSPPAPPGVGSKWFVIAVGSRGFVNYRHHADACHAYHIAKKSGVPEDHIILMMQDNVAHSSENPFPGKLFNRNGDDVPDVYAGCKPDYRGKEVTAELFLNVITGNPAAGGKVLRSGPKDRVFLNFIDHGGVGIVSFPNGPFLHVKDLSAALKTMQRKRMFNELVFYMEACESGSMFPDLAADGKIFAVTAANAHESSWGYYCMPKNDTVNGKHLGTCLGDLFSISWMEDSDLGMLGTETFATQAQRVVARTTKSHVMTFGDKSFINEPLGNIQFEAMEASMSPTGRKEGGAVNVRDIHLEYYRARWLSATESEKDGAWMQFQKAHADRENDKRIFMSIAERACTDTNATCAESIQTWRLPLENLDCHKSLVDIVHTYCPDRAGGGESGWNSFNMQFSQVLVNICELPATSSKGLAALGDIVRRECIARIEVVV